MKITKITKIANEPVFDIMVEAAHHYILDNGVITHNSGLEYAASTIVFLSKKKDKDKETKVSSGAIITAHLRKARLTIEDRKVETLLNYQKGIDKYYGLLPLAEKLGVVQKVANKYEFPSGTKEYESVIIKNPAKFFTTEILDLIDSKCKVEFMYGNDDEEDDLSADETEAD